MGDNVTVKAQRSEECEQATATVRRVLADRPIPGSWSLSLTRLQSFWSLWAVSVDTPGQPRRTVVGPGTKLDESIQRVLAQAAE